jgi:uncharacterized UBP type Zn finger protein
MTRRSLALLCGGGGNGGNSGGGCGGAGGGDGGDGASAGAGEANQAPAGEGEGFSCLTAGPHWHSQSCYADAVFQLLMGHAAFVIAVLSKFTVGGKQAQFQPGSVVRELQDVVRHATQYENPLLVQPAHVERFTLCRLREAVTRSACAAGMERTYTSNTWQDAGDFLRDLLCAVNREAVASHVDGSAEWRDAQAYTSAAEATKYAPRDPLLDLFAFLTKTTVACHKCRGVSERYETTLSMTAYTPPGTTAPLDALLDTTELLDGDNQYMCFNCGCKHDATKCVGRVVDEAMPIPRRNGHPRTHNGARMAGRDPR